VFRRTLEREKLGVTWSALTRVYRRMELRGEIRGGRFVAGFDGEQYALPDAVTQLRAVRRRGLVAPPTHLAIRPGDPLDLPLTPAPPPRVSVEPLVPAVFQSATW
jgi:ATP-dependent helicase Lhr and Lhr-like helicase